MEGKIHIYCSDMDNYYLNNPVYLIEEFLQSTTDPYYEGEVDYGDHTQPDAISRLRYDQMYALKILERILKTTPPGGDISSWRY